MNKIKYYRKESKLTLIELSEASNVSVGYICHLEKETRKNPSYNIMSKIALALDKNIGDIFLL